MELGLIPVHKLMKLKKKLRQKRM